MDALACLGLHGHHGISIKEREELLRSAEYMLRQREADLEGLGRAPGVLPKVRGYELLFRALYQLRGICRLS